LQIISFVFWILQNHESGKWFVLLIMHEIDRGGGHHSDSNFQTYDQVQACNERGISPRSGGAFDPPRDAKVG
jgi:hypothetical protein